MMSSTLCLQRLSGRHVLMLIDACHSGTSHKGVNLSSNESLGVKPVRIGRERWQLYTKSLKCTDKSWASGKKTVHVMDVDDEELRIAVLAAAADHELARATHKGSLFTLGVRKAIHDATREQRSLNLRRLKERVANFIQDNTSPREVHHPQLWGKSDFPMRLSTPRADGPIWRRLVEFADRDDINRLGIKANRDRYRVGDELVLTIDVPRAGYLNVVNVGSQDNSTVLFPNKYHRDNYVQEGELRIPTPEMQFRLQAGEPIGPSLNVAFLTEKPIDLYEDGVGGRDKDGRYEVLMNALSAKAMKSLKSVTVKPTSGYRAAGGKVIVQVAR